MKKFLCLLALILFTASAISSGFNGEATSASIDYWPTTLFLGGGIILSLA